jgi:deoxyribonuclease-4
MSISGGFEQAAERARKVGANALQVFVKSSNQWRARPLSADEGPRFTAACRAAGVERVVAHDSYLINLASGNPDLWKRSLEAFVVEMQRCDALGIPALIMHPGAHGGDGEAAGLERLTRAFNSLEERLPDARVKILVETTAGQGTTLGHRFEQLRSILDAVSPRERFGICLDTCHVFAAGYDLRAPADYERSLGEFERIVGTDRLGAIHLNDSKKELGSRVDRHAHIGQGHLGLQAFENLLNDSRLQGLAMVLETPKQEDLHEDRENLERLRSLLRPLSSGRSVRRASTAGHSASRAARTPRPRRTPRVP